MRLLHVANGSCTTRLIELAGIPGERSIWADALHDGPVPGDISDEALREVRARHLADAAHDWASAFAELTRWDAAVGRAREFDEVVLWFEHDLFDQLALIQLLTRIDAVRRSGSSEAFPDVSLVCIDRFGGHPAFKGLGELTPVELGSLWGTRSPVNAAQYAVAERAWAAFRSTDPRDIEAFLQTDSSSLPFLKAALGRHLEEFPDSKDGLSRTERRVLEIARTSVDSWTAFTLVHEGETAFYIADLSFWGVVQDLSQTDPPLLSLGNPPDSADKPHAMPRMRVETTLAGRRVIEQQTDRVALTGIDIWRGGVHQQGRGPLWRWDRAGRLLIHA